mmetsp:Transcript_54172/g.121776  ORF Transcript_54172/g.121776 Transcript_54172/m.121776 type:complete len:215 (+) Transcript_54172:86-730(+)
MASEEGQGLLHVPPARGHQATRSTSATGCHALLDDAACGILAHDWLSGGGNVLRGHPPHAEDCLLLDDSAGGGTGSSSAACLPPLAGCRGRAALVCIIRGNGLDGRSTARDQVTQAGDAGAFGLLLLLDLNLTTLLLRGSLEKVDEVGAKVCSTLVVVLLVNGLCLLGCVDSLEDILFTVVHLSDDLQGGRHSEGVVELPEERLRLVCLLHGLI